MGKLMYGPFSAEFQFDDRLLAHLQIVIGAKLRRHESFFFVWRDEPAVGDGRSALWLSPSIPLYFKFYGSKSPEINREWLEVLSASANSSTGLQILDEPVPGSSNGHGHAQVRSHR